MKIIIIDSKQQFCLVPDSALLLKNRPFFCPDYVDSLHAKIALVVKINRLGKYIQEKFASTYYEEIGLAIHFYDKNSLNNLISKGLPWERAICFDGSFALSEFVKLSETAKFCVRVQHVRTHVGIQNFVPQHDPDEQTFPIEPILQKIPTAISELSTYMTLKTGDYIAFELGELSAAPLAINDTVCLLLGNREMVRTMVK